ncbi:hypothetical protein [Thiorhodococcus minor]|uniref:Uncharacterized protein n=1 Tax=Thiorhodococcus minor TaxID=57489 RepID=A0A6M0JTB2_9GAMM|nr:hypothetical protein [Thiorhodococcus minor]NEV60354.1 hypothetical protein [Thiorhodococcus minor]
MPTLPDVYQEILSPLIAQARRILEQGESLAPFAFVGNLAQQSLLAVALRTDSEAGKDASAAEIRQIARQLQADFVFVITEAWTLPPEQAPRYQAILAEYGSIGASPYRLDSVSFALETDQGMWAAQVPLAASGQAPGARTFATPRFTRISEVGGRLTGLLDGAARTARTLH